VSAVGVLAHLLDAAGQEPDRGAGGEQADYQHE
jgi:hypothetical protein